MSKRIITTYFNKKISVPIVVVGSVIAIIPVDGSTNDNNFTIVLPAISGIEEGDTLLAFLGTKFSNILLSRPSGAWSNLHEITAPGNKSYIEKKIATASEPATYTWTTDSKAARTGCMIAIRGGSIEDSALTDLTLTVPTLSNSVGGSILIAGGAALNFSAFINSYITNAPLVEQKKHFAKGIVAYDIPMASIIAIEENLSVGSIAGRSFGGQGAATSMTGGVIINPI